ncbi:MAG: hypothetical protein P8Z36_05305 [Gemmatimonadota bacterium]|jgi:hypothetical protein
MHTTAKPVLVLCGLLAACTTSTAPAVTTWEATLAAVSPRDLLEGTVAVLSQHDRLNAGIQINNAPAAQNLTWQLRSGSCDQPGDIVGGRAVYPSLSPDSLGSASAQAIVDRTLSADGQYQASVLNANSTVIACGELQRR